MLQSLRLLWDWKHSFTEIKKKKPHYFSFSQLKYKLINFLLRACIWNCSRLKHSPFIQNRIKCVGTVCGWIILSCWIEICYSIVRITAAIIVLNGICNELRFTWEHKIIDVILKILWYKIIIFVGIVQYISVVIFI